MDKTSTLIYSVHNLASQTKHGLTNADDFDGKIEFSDIYALLSRLPLFDIDDKIVENILKNACKTV
ncbi:MAG: hypothetical protein JXB34_06115 [Bacteroidales bacterium]|nr:hypothetical protein [Bacteroidales bacterium]